MASVDYAHLADAVGTTVPYGSGRLPNNYGDAVRLILEAEEATIVTYDPLVSVCRRFPVKGGESLDVCISGRKLEAVVNSLGKTEEVTLELHKDGLLEFSQGNASIALDTMDVSGFPNADLGEMVPVYSGLNPINGIEAMKHVVGANVGTVMLHDVLLFMEGSTYLLGARSTVRGSFSLVGPEAPEERKIIPVQIKGVQALAGLGAEINVFADARRLVVADSRGHVTIAQSAVELKTLPQKVTDLFGSLVLLGQIKVDTKALTDILKNAGAVLANEERRHIYLTLKGNGDELLVSGKEGRNAFARAMPAKCSKNYAIHADVERLLAFCRASEDEEILIRVMDSPKNPHAMNFVHLVDSRLHEIVGIPLQHPIEEVK